MKSFVLLLLFEITLSQDEPLLDSFEFCKIVRGVVVSENLGQTVQFKGELIGVCDAVIYETPVLKSKFELKAREYNCDDNWKIAILSMDHMFLESVKKAMQFDKIVYKKGKLIVTYSIVEFYHAPYKGFVMRKLSTKKVRLLKSTEGYVLVR